MSRAFVKEGDGDDGMEALPDRPLGDGPNLVTARGRDLIEAEYNRLLAALEEARARDDRGAQAEVARDLRYWAARRATAEVVTPTQDTEVVRFGHRVTIEREDGERQSFTIVGQDEADPPAGSLSFASPMGRALIGKSCGDIVTVSGHEAEIIAITQADEAAAKRPRAAKRRR